MIELPQINNISNNIANRVSVSNVDFLHILV